MTSTIPSSTVVQLDVDEPIQFYDVQLSNGQSILTTQEGVEILTDNERYSNLRAIPAFDYRSTALRSLLVNPYRVVMIAPVQETNLATLTTILEARRAAEREAG